MIYDGVVAQLLGIDKEEIRKALQKQFRKKVKAAELNWNAASAGYEFTEKNLKKGDRFSLQRMDETQGKIIIDGNSAAALGAMFAGVTVVTWYPITPSSSVCETLIELMKRYRIDPETKKATFAIVQAEDELAAIGMVLGAGWAGARAMTSTSGPGISLMSEFVGFGYYAEIPAVISTSSASGLRRDSPRARPRATSFQRLPIARRHEAPDALSVFRRGVLHDGHRGIQSCRKPANAHFFHERPRPWDEQLDVGRVPVSGEAHFPRQGLEQGRTGTGWGVSRAIAM